MPQQPKKITDARQIARDVVSEWANQLVATAESHTVGGVYQIGLESLFDRLQEALEAEHSKEYGPITDAAGHTLMARETGYLIGVQVGLRLRNVEVR
jgi:hypothetical protein